MVLRSNGWRVAALVAASAAAAGAIPQAGAQQLQPPQLPPAGIPQSKVVMGAPTGMQPRLVWGGPLPADLPERAPAASMPAPSAAAPDRTFPMQGEPDIPGHSAAPAPLPAPAVVAPWPEQGLSSRPGLPEDALGGASDPAAERFGAAPRPDPWSGLKSVTPGAVKPAVPSYASLSSVPPPRAQRQAPRNRGALEDEVPGGYSPLPQSEQMCRAALAKLRVRFVDSSSISKGRSCGIAHPVKVTEVVPGIAMLPPATLNCQTALRVAQWMQEEVKPAARWKLWKKPTALLNASSYRCSRIAGSSTVSEHGSGNALDVRGFRFSDGSTMEIEKKGIFSFRERGFQKEVRTSGCRYFGTVLGPGYNEDHADHLHLDTKKRKRSVCK